MQPRTERGKLLVAKNYVNTVCDKDISRAAKEKLDPKIARAILRSYARNVSTTVDKTTILAVAPLGLGPGQLMTQLKTFGFIFECMCVRDLKVYSSPFGGEISHYRDRYGLEADIVLHLEDGRYALIECKLGSSEIESGAGHLKEIVGLIRKHNEQERQVSLREPDLLMVIAGGEDAYTRPDGVHVIPLACLKQ